MDSVSEWHFEVPADSIHVTSASSGTTWSGTAVLSGSVWAAVTIDGQADTLHGSLQVTNRTDAAVWRWDKDDWDFDDDAAALPCENYGRVYFEDLPAKLGSHGRRLRCVGGRIEPYIGDEGGIEAGYDAIPVTGGGPNNGLWYVVAVHYRMDTGASINPFFKAGYSPPALLDGTKVQKNCQKKLGTGPPYAANFYDYNLKCSNEGDPFLEGNLGHAILAHEGIGTKPSMAPDANGHEAQLRLGAGDPMNDPKRAVERIIGKNEVDLMIRVGQEIQRLDGILNDAGDPDHIFVKDNFVENNGNCDKTELYRDSLNMYEPVRIFIIEEDRRIQCL